MARTQRRRKTTAIHRLLTVLFVLVFPVTVLAWIGFGIGVAMVVVLDADAPKPPEPSSVPLPAGWSVVDEKVCEAKNCSTRVVVVEAPADAEVIPPPRRLIESLKAAGWRVDADTPLLAESPEGITVNAAPPVPATPEVVDPAAPTTTTAAPPTTRDRTSPTTESTTTTVPQTTTTVSAAVAARRAAVTVGYRSEAAGRSYHREGVAMRHIAGFYRLLALLTAATVGLGLLLFVLDQFVS